MPRPKKKKKEKVIYYDDNSTVADMSRANPRGEEQKPPPPRKKSTAKEKWNTYWHTVKIMILPLCIALVILGALYLILMAIGGNL